jgi:uncharacterized protein (UPF0332 family)
MNEDQERYATAARELLTKAQEALAEGDLRQASEKGWGAAAQIVKAVATRRGWPHQNHAALFEVVRQSMLETGDRGLQENFHIANSLHYNFYENWMLNEAIEVGLEQVREFIHDMERFLAGAT